MLQLVLVCNSRTKITQARRSSLSYALLIGYHKTQIRLQDVTSSNLIY
jgi:hypothetical protein